VPNITKANDVLIRLTLSFTSLPAVCISTCCFL